MLIKLAEAVESVRSNAYRMMAPMIRSYGVRRLPDEVLLLIFSFVCRINQENQSLVIKDVLHISHTCRHFRSLTLMSPSLWAYLDLNVPVECNRIAFERSNDLPLSIGSSLDMIRWFCKHSTDLHPGLLPNKRWKHVDIELSQVFAHHMVLHDEFGDSENVELPILSSMHLASSDFILDVPGFSSWTWPHNALVSAHSNEFEDGYVFPFGVVHEHTLQVDLTRTNWRADFSEETKLLTRVNRLICNIWDLGFSSIPVHVLTDPSNEKWKLPQHLNRLNNLELHVHCGEPILVQGPYISASLVLEFIPFWKITFLSIHYDQMGVIFAILENNRMTWNGREVLWENLEVLHLSSCSEPPNFQTCDHWDLRSTSYHLPKLRSITFENALPRFTSPHAKLPKNWNDITIKYCRFVTSDFLQRIVRIVLWWSERATGELDGDPDLSPKHLLLWRCNNIDKIFIQRLRRISSSNINIEWR